jgi:amino-acid N-acetyltransferase
MPAYTLRAATSEDQTKIVELVHRERLNPNGLGWPAFVVATCGGEVVGAVQIRRHPDGSRELASLVVAAEHRGRGVASRLIASRLGHNGAARAHPVHAITARARAPFFARWGFVPIAARRAPAAVRRNHRLGQWLGGVVSVLKGRWPRRLVVLERL